MLNHPTARLPESAHYQQPWRIHDLAPEFQLEDVWALPVTGERDDFARLVRLLTAPGTAENASTLTRLLFAARKQIGRLLRWDDDPADQDASTLLRHRLPDDQSPPPTTGDSPFLPIYQTDDEWAAELVNRTVHGVLHVGWVQDSNNGYRGQLAVLVKPNGRLGSAYLLAIRPFRYAIVYPALLRSIERKWKADALTRP
ncbi:MAG: hypothetical protein QOC82_2988 [Frankiaceae bacterium]|nr:hypothetical protein [Frankiaceae bacterium]